MTETGRQWVKNNKILLCLSETYNFIIFFQRQYYFFVSYNVVISWFCSHNHLHFLIILWLIKCVYLLKEEKLLIIWLMSIMVRRFRIILSLGQTSSLSNSYYLFVTNCFISHTVSKCTYFCSLRYFPLNFQRVFFSLIAMIWPGV